MDYIDLTQNVAGVFVFFSMGMFVWGLLMFKIQYSTEKELEKELDKFRELYLKELDKNK